MPRHERASELPARSRGVHKFCARKSKWGLARPFRRQRLIASMTVIPAISPPKATARGKEPHSNGMPLEGLLTELQAIQADLLALESEFEPRLVHYTGHQKSARNLIHYLALRRHDIRQLQEQLAALGLSSLGRTESHVLAGIEAVLKVLHQLAQRARLAPTGFERGIDFGEGRKLLQANTDALLGPPPPKRGVRIMVTMPSEAAHDFQLVRQLVADGMDCMRINCAHDDVNAWAGMVANLERAKLELGRDCRAEIDLTGPKLRTGSIDPASQIVKWRPQRDIRGRVTAPARVWLTPMENPEPHGLVSGSLRVPGAVLAKLREGDRIKFAQTVYLNAGAA
jgi:pyruvate kinase